MEPHLPQQRLAGLAVRTQYERGGGVTWHRRSAVASLFPLTCLRGEKLFSADQRCAVFPALCQELKTADPPSRGSEPLRCFLCANLCPLVHPRVFYFHLLNLVYLVNWRCTRTATLNTRTYKHWVTLPLLGPATVVYQCSQFIYLLFKWFIGRPCFELITQWLSFDRKRSLWLEVVSGMC